MIGLDLLFMRIFVGALGKKREIPWLTWLIPYFLAVVMALWIFVLGNPISFVFRDFYLSLPVWLNTMDRFGRSLVLAVVLYILAYVVAKNLSKGSNTSVAMAAVSVLTGMAAVFFNEFAALGMALLFVLSLFLNSGYEKKETTESTSRLFVWLALIVPVSFAIGALLFSNPVIPLQRFFTAKSPTAAATKAVDNGHPVSGETVGAAPPKRRRAAKPDLVFPGWLYDFMIYSVGSAVMAIGTVGIVLAVLNRRKKKMRIRNFFKYLWIVLSAVFLFLIAMYTFGMLRPNRSFQPVGSSGIPGPSGSFRLLPTPSSSPSALPPPTGHRTEDLPLIFTILVVAVIAVSIFFGIREFVKYTFVRAEESGEPNDSDETGGESPEKTRDFTGTPRQTVLFYYGLLRSKIGNPSSTPYEFKKELEKLIGDKAEPLTEIFVKLRYQGMEISREEADTVKEEVSKLIG